MQRETNQDHKMGSLVSNKVMKWILLCLKQGEAFINVLADLLQNL